jgi:hypothetical protein
MVAIGVIDAIGDIVDAGDVVGIGWAVAASALAPETHAPANTMPTNQRFM